MDEFHERFGKHVHILDWALHLDEGTPHIHERHVFDCENKYGEIAPQQEKALEALGFELPKLDKPLGRYNNRKITFDAACRTMLFEIAKRHGLELDEVPEYGGRAKVNSGACHLGCGRDVGRTCQHGGSDSASGCSPHTGGRTA